MEAVKSFNSELSSLYDVKPPISKAKMTALTRGAIKAIKFYKHVVQSVEKFILKCKPEYKVPGLYVIDSIVRQSRHQFGSDKDVFAPRFAKNMQLTFVNLFRCPPEDKSKVIRVLNLWQKNQVFAPDVVQPLFDLADPNHPIHREQAALALASNGMTTNTIGKGSPISTQRTPTKTGCKSNENSLWQGTPQQQDATSALAHLGVASLTANPNALLQLSGQAMDPNMLAQLQTLQRLLLRQTSENAGIKQEGAVHFDRKLLDFDYGSDEEEDHANPSPKTTATSSGLETVGSLLANPEVMRQLQNLQQQLSQQTQIELEEKMRKLQEMKQQEEEFDKHLAQTVPNLPFAAECELKPVSHATSPGHHYKHEPAYVLPSVFDLSQPPPGYKQQLYETGGSQEDAVESEVEFVDNHDNGEMEVINLDHVDSRSESPHDDRYARRRRSRSRDRSRDRDRDRRPRRSRSRSRSRRRRSRSRERDREREKDKEKEREKDRERRKRGLPPLKKDNLSVCSTTLWVGHLSKLVHQEDLSDTFGEFGDIVSIDLIPPRGCAFIVMNRRQDAARCLAKLKNHKMQGKAITLAWAPGKGVKGKDYKDYWEVELGVSYIPWSKVKEDIDLELLEEGGMVDEDTMPDWLKAKQAEMQPKPAKVVNLIVKSTDVVPADTAAFVPMPDVTPISQTATPNQSVDTSQPPPLHTGGLLPPPPMNMSIVSPFSLNTRLLGPMGMQLPPGMMPNVPIGVPPPNMPGALMSNQLLGMGSPFGMPGPMSQMSMSGSDKQVMPPNSMSNMIGDGNMSNIPETLLGMQTFQMMNMNHNDDNMDIEMEDVEKPEKHIPLSDQLLAAISGGFNNSSNSGSGMGNIGPGICNSGPPMDNIFNAGNIPPLMSHHTDIDDRQAPNRENRDSRPRDRNDRNDRDRPPRNSRERNRDRDRGGDMARGDINRGNRGDRGMDMNRGDMGGRDRGVDMNRGDREGDMNRGDMVRPDRGGDMGRPNRGGDMARPDRGGDMGRSGRGGDMGRPDRSGDMGKPERGGDMGRPDRGGDMVRVDRVGDLTRPDRGVDIGRLDRGGDMGRPDRGGDMGRPDRGTDIGRPDRVPDIGRPDRGGDMGGRGDRRDRNNRWTDRDRRDRNEKEQIIEIKSDPPLATLPPKGSGKTLAERLRDMAHDGVVVPIRPPRDRADDKPPPLFEGPPIDRPNFPLDCTDFPPGNSSGFPSDLSGFLPDRPNFVPNHPGVFPPGHPDFQPDLSGVFPPGHPDFQSDRPGGFPLDLPNFPVDRPNFLSGDHSNFPPGIGPNFPPGDLSNFPPGTGPNFPLADRLNFPPEDRSNFPPGVGPNFPPGDHTFPPGDGPNFPFPNNNGNDIDIMETERMDRERIERVQDMGWRDRMEPDMFRRSGRSDDFPREDFDPRRRCHPDDFPARMERSEFDPRMPHSDFDNRRSHNMHPDEMDHDRFDFNMRGQEQFDRREGGFGRGDDGRMMDDFDPRMRGGPGTGREFYPRDGFGPPRPLLRGHGPDSFSPRPLMGRGQQGPPMFHPRGLPMGMRGPRPGSGPWMDNSRPNNYSTRFEGPDFFNNRMPFDDHPRHRGRYDDRRRHRPDMDIPGEERLDRRSGDRDRSRSGDRDHRSRSDDRDRDRKSKSRWGKNSPALSNTMKRDEDTEPEKPRKEASQENENPHQEVPSCAEEVPCEKEETCIEEKIVKEQMEEIFNEDSEMKSQKMGGTTPLHDEVQEVKIEEAIEVQVTKDVIEEEASA